jgi:hypothetical protein
MTVRSSILFAFIIILATLTFNSFTEGENHAPIIEFSTAAIDFGQISKGSDGSKKISFSNKGASPLIITKCEGECSCTAVEWPKYAIQPGKSGELTIKYNTDIVGHFSKTIYIYSNNLNGIYELHVSGTVTQ